MGRPRRIVLIRHGESEGNEDDTIYRRVPDHALDLTDHGMHQAERAGAALREVFGRQRVQAFVSPYRRTWRTYQALRLDARFVQAREEPRLREQDWGNWQDVED